MNQPSEASNSPLPPTTAHWDDSFNLIAETRQQVAEVSQTAREAIQAHFTDAAQLAAFIEQHGTPVYPLPGGAIAGILLNCCLWALGFAPGFIPPNSGWRYRILSQLLPVYQRLLAIRRPSSLSASPSFTHGVFVLPETLFTVGFLSHQLHHWLSFRAGLPGYSTRAQSLYRRFWVRQRGQFCRDVSRMKSEEILALKAAINRDLEALKFLKAMANEVLIPARQAQRLTQGRASA